MPTLWLLNNKKLSMTLWCRPLSARIWWNILLNARNTCNRFCPTSYTICLMCQVTLQSPGRKVIKKWFWFYTQKYLFPRLPQIALPLVATYGAALCLDFSACDSRQLRTYQKSNDIAAVIHLFHITSYTPIYKKTPRQLCFRPKKYPKASLGQIAGNEGNQRVAWRWAV